MLKLKKLELLGFKSFCGRQELHFNGGGISAIVGPNGCGKSNISDSISWVLGERSAKTLRGTRMDDVIFNGSRDRKPSGLATVSLTLIDPEAYLEGKLARGEHSNGSTAPARAKSAEITVTRKLYRSGESDYLINGKSCRLRDIQELFMGTGLGPQHYAIIEQGRIGQILSSRPIDRRAFIEEAAGVTKFKSKRRLAELKLEASRQNLNRVNDILQEVIRQVNSLKRQASRARRYEELRKRWRENLTMLMADRAQEMGKTVNEANSRMEQADAECNRLSGGVAELEAAFQHNRAQEQRCEKELEQQRSELSQLTVEIERLRSRMEQQARTAEETLNRKQHAEGEIVHLNERLAALQDELRVEEEAVQQVNGQAEEVRQRLTEKTAELERSQLAIDEAEQKQETTRQHLFRLLSEASTLKNELAKMDEFLAGIDRQLARVRDEQSAADEELAHLGQNRVELERQIESRQQHLDALGERRQQIQREISDHRQESQTRRQRIEQLQRELSRIKARKESLEEILSHHAYTTETVKNLFALVENGRFDSFEPLGILADFIDVDSECERVTEEFLRDELEFVVVKGWQEANEGIGLLHSDLEGRATFLVHPESPVSPEPAALGPETGVAGRLADHIRLTNGLAGSASILLPRLRACYLVEDEEAARRLAVQYPGLYFLLRNGRCYHGYTVSGGKKTSAGPLALKRELRELTPRLTAAEQEIGEEVDLAQQAETELARKSESLEGLQAELQATEKEILGVEHDLRQLNSHADRARKRLEVAQSEIGRLEKESTETLAQKQTQEQALAEREADRENTERSLAQVRELIQANREQRSRLAEEQTALRTELATLEERRKAAWASLERIGRLTQEQQERRDRIASQISQWEADHARLVADNENLERQIAEQTSVLESLQHQVAQSADDLQAARDRAGALEEQLKQKRAELETARQDRSAIELRLVELRSDLRHLDEDCRRDLGCALEELELAEPLTTERRSEAEQLHQELTRKIENLGPVNVLALEEFEEAQQRMEFLDTQRQDLLDSIHDTKQAIAEMDTISRQKFHEAFEAINKNFREMFTSLFGGGTGEMRLTESEDPAEAGIEIVASPPGKRLQNIALLSGGEKSLTALGLLMATFRYRPSPFCVLDEVDAALDETNLIRFRRLLQDMSEHTQFILITHSKTTMEAAQTLYGVTMQEPGVSKLVSVRIADHDAPFREAGRETGQSSRAATARA